MDRVKAIILGIPRQKLKSNVNILQNIEKEMMPEEKYEQMLTMTKRNLLLKIIALPSSVILGMQVPFPPEVIYSGVAKAGACLLTYRTLTVPHTFALHQKISECIEEYNIEEQIKQKLEKEELEKEEPKDN